MKRRYGKCLLLFLFSLILLIVNAHQVQADLAAQEIDLGAWPYEANLDNQGMLSIFKKRGFESRIDPDDNVVLVNKDL